MARRFNLEAPKIKPQKSKQSNLIQDQARSNAQQMQLGPGAVATGGTDRLTGTSFQTPAGQDFEIQKTVRAKAAEDAKKASIVFPLLDQIENDYKTLYADILDKGGIEGQKAAYGKYTNDILLKKNPQAAALYSQLESNIPIISRSLMEVGNLSEQEQARAGKGLPILGPNRRISNLFMPDDPQTVIAKLARFKQQFRNIYERNLQVSQTGDVSNLGPKGTDPSMPGQVNPIDRASKLNSIKERFKQRKP